MPQWSKPHLNKDADKDIMTGESVVSSFDGRFTETKGILDQTLEESRIYEPYSSKRPTVKELEALDSVSASVFMLRRLLSEVQELQDCKTTPSIIMEWLGEYTVERVGYREK